MSVRREIARATDVSWAWVDPRMTQLLDAPVARPVAVPGTAIVYSVVVPIYGNRDSLAALVERLVALNESRGGLLPSLCCCKRIMGWRSDAQIAVSRVSCETCLHSQPPKRNA